MMSSFRSFSPRTIRCMPCDPVLVHGQREMQITTCRASTWRELLWQPWRALVLLFGARGRSPLSAGIEDAGFGAGADVLRGCTGVPSEDT
jgi:hypothetical protein